MPDDTDLVYDGRARKRPSGASDLTQRIYTLLHDHPDGMTRDEVWEILREGWLETDYYRAYEQYRVVQRKSYNHAPSRRRIKTVEYGSDEFKRRAQRWAVSRVLGSMSHLGTALHAGDRWFKGERAPKVAVPCEVKVKHLVPLDAARQRDAHRADTSSHVRREQVKARLFARLQDGRVKGETRAAIQDAYDYLTTG